MVAVFLLLPLVVVVGVSVTSGDLVQFPPDGLSLKWFGVALENQTPLWYYVLAEAERLTNGVTLGPTGGRIVGEVFIGLLQLDLNSYLRVLPTWTPTLRILAWPKSSEFSLASR